MGTGSSGSNFLRASSVAESGVVTMRKLLALVGDRRRIEGALGPERRPALRVHDVLKTRVASRFLALQGPPASRLTVSSAIEALVKPTSFAR